MIDDGIMPFFRACLRRRFDPPGDFKIEEVDMVGPKPTGDVLLLVCGRHLPPLSLETFDPYADRTPSAAELETQFKDGGKTAYKPFVPSNLRTVTLELRAFVTPMGATRHVFVGQCGHCGTIYYLDANAGDVH